MADKSEVSADVKSTEGGRIIFADEVVATIAALAAADVKGVYGMSGGVADGITEILGKKNITKGVKVEVGAEEAAVDLSVLVQYGFRIQEVCQNIQSAVKNAIETMTGLKVVEVNVFVQAVTFEQPDQKAEKKKEKEAEKAEKLKAAEAEKAEKAEKEPDPPRVR